MSFSLSRSRESSVARAGAQADRGDRLHLRDHRHWPAVVGGHAHAAPTGHTHLPATHVSRQAQAPQRPREHQTEAGVEYHFGAASNPSFAIGLTAFGRSGAAPSGCRSRSMLRGSSRCSPDSSKYVCSRSSPTCGSGQRRSRWDHTRTCRQAIAGLGTTRAIASHGHHQDRPAYQHADHRLLLDSG
jgi:hypothetical protein